VCLRRICRKVACQIQFPLCRWRVSKKHFSHSRRVQRESTPN
jgi:hypothetical protein